MTAIYNEFDPRAVHVLRTLIDEDVIAPGRVDSRSIKELSADDLKGATQVHLFAGGGLWSVAARLAGWPDDKPLWTGSCPCQPFSVAGKGAGRDDPRHLWPDMFRLIRAGRPAVVVGEQVAGKAGYDWFDGVSADLESEDYACRSVDVPACAVDAPHIRQRLYWLAVDDSQGQRRREGWAEHDVWRGRHAAAGADAPGALDHGLGTRLEGHGRHGDRAAGRRFADRSTATPDDRDSLQSDADIAIGWFRNQQSARQFALDEQNIGAAFRPGQRNGSWWSDAEWIICHDGKARRTKPGLPLLVDGFPGRVGLWRLAGNAIVPILAAEVLRSYLETEHLG